MDRILYIPLDERPCNRKYPAQVAGALGDVELVSPPLELLGDKKRPGDVDALWAFAYDAFPSCARAIVSMEMMVYGGLVPSRLHVMPADALLERVERLRALRACHPGAVIDLSALIMRVPAYDSDDEEPEYYARYGRRLFEMSWHTDKAAREGLPEDDEALEALLRDVPDAVRDDYFGRRARNARATRRMVELLAEGVADFMVIPQDDTARYGVQGREQSDVRALARERGVADRLMFYPGADEIGMTLLARALNARHDRTPSAFPRFSSALGPTIVPSYEDRPYLESLKSHIMAAGLCLSHDDADCDFALYLNTPGTRCSEAAHQANAPRTNDTHRNLMEFAQSAARHMERGTPVAFADVAYANGADMEWVEWMGRRDLSRRAWAYAAWNTNGNTLGTALCMASAALCGADMRPLVAYRLLEDAGYMGVVRRRLRERYSDADCAAQCDDPGSPLMREALDGMRAFLRDVVAPQIGLPMHLRAVAFPWRRLFEIDLALEVDGHVV